MSKTQLYVRRGRDDFGVTNNASTDIQEVLPVGVYRLDNVFMVGWVFQRVEDFAMPSKFYGSLSKQGDRIMQTYLQRAESGHSTGVLLRGSKGAGKTLLAKKIAMDSNLPVILINQPFADDSFKELVAGLGQCVIIFDEFEKIYHDRNTQNSLLTLFDGVFASKALMFVIVNDHTSLVGPLINRPGRLFYSLEYEGLDREFIEDYCEDRLNNKSNIVGIVSVATMFESFNFDMLQSLVEEMNRFDETAAESIKYLNISSGYFSKYSTYETKAFSISTGEALDISSRFSHYEGHPLHDKNQHYFSYYEEPQDDPGETLSADFYLDSSNLVSVEPNTDTFVFEHDGVRVSLTKVAYGSKFTPGNLTSNVSKDTRQLAAKKARVKPGISFEMEASPLRKMPSR